MTRAVSTRRLEGVYRALVNQWRESADRLLVREYDARADASWINSKLKAWEAEVQGTINSGKLEEEIDGAHDATERAATRQVASLIKISISDVVLERERKAFRKRNLRLIKRLGRSEVSELRALLVDAEKTGERVEGVKKKIERRLEVSKSHAELLARDQILKLNGQVTGARQQQAGIRKYKWSTSRDERVRKPHKALDGKIFPWGDPPITNKEGDRNEPGGDYQCRCVAIPVLE